MLKNSGHQSWCLIFSSSSFSIHFLFNQLLTSLNALKKLLNELNFPSNILSHTHKMKKHFVCVYHFFTQKYCTNENHAHFFFASSSFIFILIFILIFLLQSLRVNHSSNHEIIGSHLITHIVL